MKRDPGRVFFTADTHFGDAGARALYRRPFVSVAAMDRALIEAWNERVAPGDTIWFLGDFAVRHPEPQAVLAALQGDKHLVFGNNDTSAVRALTGWASVAGLMELTVDEVKLTLCHYALRSWPGQAKGALNLHGHSHGRLKRMPGQFDVGVDVQGYRPVTLAEIRGRPEP